MKIGKTRISKLDTGNASQGAFGNGRAGNAGQVRSGHHFHGLTAGGATPTLTGPRSTGRPVQRDQHRKKMY